MPAWKLEKLPLDCYAFTGEPDDSKRSASLPPPAEAYVGNAEEFVCLTYLAFIQSVLARLRGLVAGGLAVFFACVAAAALLTLDPRPAVNASLLLLFVAFASIVVSVFWQMHRNDTLSYITNTDPGELGGEFWVQAVAFITGPVLALIAVAFPQFATWLFSFLQPGNS
jgi:hypothetical protein